MDFIRVEERKIAMKKISALLVIAVVAVSVITPPLLHAAEAVNTATTDVGNKLCPVSGNPVSGQDFVEYQGERYGLCCAGCKQIFLSDPVKYIAKMKAQEAQANPAAGM